MKRVVCATLSAAVCLSATPVLGQDYGFYDAFAGRRDAATATANFRVPFGAKAEKPTYGLTLNYGPAARSPYASDGAKPDLKLADLRFSSEGLDQARLGGFDFAQTNGGLDGDRLNMMEGKDSTTWIIIGLVVVGAVVWAIADDDDDDNDD